MILKKDVCLYRLGFEMDNVSSVQDLPNKIASMNYYNDPQFTKFTKNEKYHKVLVIQVSTLMKLRQMGFQLYAMLAF